MNWWLKFYLAIVVVLMAFTLSKMWMTVIQAACGFSWLILLILQAATEKNTK